jgi:hypothetical protein
MNARYDLHSFYYQLKFYEVVKRIPGYEEKDIIKRNKYRSDFALYFILDFLIDIIIGLIFYTIGMYSTHFPWVYLYHVSPCDIPVTDCN